jgi:hypothetical protein
MSVPNDPASNPQPDVDVTVGRTPLVGDAPPSDGNDVDVSVAPTTTLQRAGKALKHRAALEGSSAERPAQRTFHTASARAAAFPGLQPEIETSGSPLPVHDGWAASPDLPLD